MEVASTTFHVVQDEDMKIFDRLMQHNESGLSDLYDRYAPLLYCVLMRMLRSVEDAENILHDVFIELWNMPEKYQNSSGTLYCWLLATARRRALSGERSKRLKKQSHQVAQNILPVYSDYVLTHTPITPFGEEILHSVTSAFNQLTEDEQQVLALGFYEGYTQSEIAKGLSIPAWTVNWSLRKSLAALTGLAGNADVKSDDHHKKYIELCAGHVIGILEGDEQNEIESHFAQGCDICIGEHARLSQALQILPLGLPPVPLSPELKERVLFSSRLSDVIKSSAEKKEESVSPSKAAPEELKRAKESESPQWLYILVFILSILLIGCAIYIFSMRRNTGAVNSIPQQATAMDAQQELDRSNSILNFLETRQMELTMLENPKGRTEEYGKLFWDLSTRMGLLYVTTLPVVPSDKNYQMWLMKDGQYISVSVFVPVANGKRGNYIRVQLPFDVAIKNISGFVITLEPKGGMGYPTGEVFLQGKVSR